MFTVVHTITSNYDSVKLKWWSSGAANLCYLKKNKNPSVIAMEKTVVVSRKGCFSNCFSGGALSCSLTTSGVISNIKTASSNRTSEQVIYPYNSSTEGRSFLPR